jgi:hypothetical protein
LIFFAWQGGEQPVGHRLACFCGSKHEESPCLVAVMFGNPKTAQGEGSRPDPDVE